MLNALDFRTFWRGGAIDPFQLVYDRFQSIHERIAYWQVCLVEAGTVYLG